MTTFSVPAGPGLRNSASGSPASQPAQASRGAEEVHGPLLPLMRAAAELHTEIQSSDELSDIEETLEAALTADDGHGIDEGCDIYRSLLASRLKDIWRSYRGPERIASLSAAQPMPWSR